MKHISEYLAQRRLELEIASDNVPIRCIKDGDWYWINKKLLTMHGHSIRASGIAVYSVLASMANAQSQTCFPSYRTIARIAGISKRTVSRRIRQLEKIGLIRRERQNRKSIFYLLRI